MENAKWIAKSKGDRHELLKPGKTVLVREDEDLGVLQDTAIAAGSLHEQSIS